MKKQKDGTFKCPCHGSLFDATGHVTLGPAEQALAWYRSEVDKAGNVAVDTSIKIKPPSVGTLTGDAS